MPEHLEARPEYHPNLHTTFGNSNNTRPKSKPIQIQFIQEKATRKTKTLV